VKIAFYQKKSAIADLVGWVEVTRDYPVEAIIEMAIASFLDTDHWCQLNVKALLANNCGSILI
jgi:hypothetical protein